MPTNAAPVAIVRWLAGLGLLQTAESWLRLDADVSAAAALIAADASSETFLSLIGAGSSLPVKNKTLPNREELIARANDMLGQAKSSIEAGHLADLRSTHSLRNHVVHHGARAGNTEAARACAAARVLGELLPMVGAAPTVVASGGGVASAVAEVVHVPDVSDELRIGDQAFIAGDEGAVADAAGYALWRLLALTSPPLRVTSQTSLPSAQPDYRDKVGKQMVRDIGGVREQLDELRAWVVAPALGITPAAFTRLIAVVGWYSAFDTGSPRGDEVRRKEPTSMADARWALEQVAEVAFRLWQTDALVLRSSRYYERLSVIVARNQERNAFEAEGSPQYTG